MTNYITFIDLLLSLHCVRRNCRGFHPPFSIIAINCFHYLRASTSCITSVIIFIHTHSSSSSFVDVIWCRQSSSASVAILCDWYVSLFFHCVIIYRLCTLLLFVALNIHPCLSSLSLDQTRQCSDGDVVFASHRNTSCFVSLAARVLVSPLQLAYSPILITTSPSDVSFRSSSRQPPAFAGSPYPAEVACNRS